MQRLLTKQQIAASVMTVTLALIGGCPGDDGGDGTDGGTDETGAGCEFNEDCEEGEACHPYLMECVSACETADDCSGDAPVCNSAADGPIEVDDFDMICICDGESCGEGEVCNPTNGLCESPCDPGTGSEDDAGTSGSDCNDEWTCYYNAEAMDTVCQPECIVSDDCGDGLPFCNDDGQCIAGCDDITAPLRVECDASFGEFCDAETGECFEGCVDELDCDEGEDCDPNSHTCVEVGCSDADDCDEDQGCDTETGDCFDLCLEPGEIGEEPCDNGDVCLPDGTCEEACSNSDCLDGTGELCQGDTDSDDFNTCVAVEDVVDDTCGSAALLTSATPGESGPIIYDLTLVTLDSPADATGIDLSACDASALVSKVTFSYYDSGNDVDFDGDIADLADFWIANETPTNGEYYASAAAEFSGDADATWGEVSLYKCFMGGTTPSEVAVVMRDDSDSWGNAACVSEAAE